MGRPIILARGEHPQTAAWHWFYSVSLGEVRNGARTPIVHRTLCGLELRDQHERGPRRGSVCATCQARLEHLAGGPMHVTGYGPESAGAMYAAGDALRRELDAARLPYWTPEEE